MRALIICIFIVSGFLPLSALHRLELRSGASVQGELLFERLDAYYIDLGFDVVSVPKAFVEQVSKLDLAGGGAVVESFESKEAERGIYSVSSSSRNESIEHWVREYGEAVTLIQTPTGLGSGFMIDPDGYLVTNDHVIAGETELTVTVFEDAGRELIRREYTNVRLVATSSDLDLALLKIEHDGAAEFETVPLASDDGLKEGETVFAIGSPLGLDRTVSEGIISVANRVINGRLYLQTTTQINPGNSGGPLFNLQGEVVGVNNMKIAAIGAEGLSFSISSRLLKLFLDNRDAYAFDPRNPNSGFRYIRPPNVEATEALAE